MITTLRRLAFRLLNAVSPSAGESDLDRELLSHVALVEDEHRLRGLSADQARLEARRTIGSIAYAKDLHRDARSFVWVDDARRDVRYAVRSFLRTPAFSAIAVLTIAVGVGANTAIFSVVRTVLLQPLPYAHGNRLVQPYENIPAAESPNRRARRQGGMIEAEFVDIRNRTTTLSRVVGVGFSLVTMMGVGDAALLNNGSSVSPGTMAMLGVQPAIGRSFTADEETSGAHVVLLSDTAWHKYFGGDSAAVNRTIAFTGNSSFTGDIVFGTAYTIVGVMPRGFHFPNDDTLFWNPAAPTRHADARRRTTMFAQLREGVTPEAAATELTQIVSAFRGSAAHPPFAPNRFELERVQDQVTARVKPALLVLMAAVGFVLLIACANVANLLLARTAARDREIAVRISLGAARGRLVRQLLTESVLLAVLGGVAGTALAFGGVRLFRMLGTNLSRFDLGTSPVFPRLDAIAIDPLVFSFALAISVLVGVLFGLAPAIRSTRQLQISRSTSRLHGALIVAEIAMAFPLLVGGSLLIRSFLNLVAVDPGYDATHALTFQVSARGDKYPPAQLKIFADDLVSRLRTMPDVVAVGYSRQLPMVQLVDTQPFRRTPEPPPPGPVLNGGEARYAGPGYLQAIGAHLVAGHWPEGPRQVAINRTLARREFGGESPIGATVYIGRSTTPRELAAVVDDQRVFGLDREPAPQFFADLSVWDGPAFTLLPVGPYFAVRTRGNPESVLRNVAAVVRQMDETAPLYNVATLEQIVSNSVTLPRMYAVLLGMFATIAVGLAAIGIYGVMAYSVVRQTREIGIRMALGARHQAVLVLILGHGARIALIGIGLGLGGAAVTTRLLRGMLFGLTPLDPTTFFAAATIFGAVAMCAAYWPARRATNVDPLVALRTE
jgi:putative ABC transport system permease protein